MRQYIVFTESGFPEKMINSPADFSKGKGDSIYCKNGGRFFCTAFLDLFQVRKESSIVPQNPQKSGKSESLSCQKWTFSYFFSSLCRALKKCYYIFFECLIVPM